MDQEMTCGWEVDRRDRQPVLCERPAKARTSSPLERERLVCGSHARSARARGYQVTDLPGPDVTVGQVWRDNDPRSEPRHVRVVLVDETHATVTLVDGAGRHWGKERRSRIRLDRFRPTSAGYRLVHDVEG